MSSTAVAYILDKTFNENGNCRPYREFSQFIKTLTSEHAPHAYIDKIYRKDGTRGFLLFYQRDDHLNYLFKPEVSASLNDNNYEAFLSTRTAQKRNIFLVDIPEEVIQKTKDEIKSEILKSTDKIIHFRSICRPYNERNYLILTAVDNASRDEILATNKTFDLFGQNYNAEIPIDKFRASGDRMQPPRST